MTVEKNILKTQRQQKMFELSHKKGDIHLIDPLLDAAKSWILHDLAQCKKRQYNFLTLQSKDTEMKFTLYFKLIILKFVLPRFIT